MPDDEVMLSRVLKPFSDNLIKYLLFMFPRRTYTVVLGKFIRTKFSARFIPWYTRRFEIDTKDLDRDLTEYLTLGQFFSRKIASSARPITSMGIASPVDGTISMFGKISNGTMLQVKGQSYSLDRLLADEESARRYESGTYITIYLSPRDYHRIHAPLDCTAVCCRHVPGTLFPVNSYGLSRIGDLFVRNERTITEFHSSEVGFVMVKVGAAGVGTVISPLIPSRQHWQRAKGPIAKCEVSQRYAKGDEVGYFALGSTVVLVFSPESDILLSVHEGEKVRMGQCIGEVESGLNCHGCVKLNHTIDTKGCSEE